jgi:uncharacterized membrane protein HdeD (DUF308 family)
MQEALPIKRVHAEPYHAGLWWRELLRGGVTLLFALLLLFTFNFFIDVLGIYLILDGALEMLPTGRRTSSRAFLTYLGSLVSIALGLFCLLDPTGSIFVLVVVVSIRLIVRGGRVMRDAQHSQYTYEGLTWLLGLALLLVGLVFLGNAVWSALHQSVPFSLILIVLFVSSYALVDGLYLLLRGLLLRLKPGVFFAPEEKAGSPPDLLADLPATARRAIIFVRYGGAHGLGHVGWAFEWNNGWFNVGAMENEEGTPLTRPQEMGFWCAHTLAPIEDVQRRGIGYDAYKVLYVTHPRPKDAWKTVIWESQQPYAVLRHNCGDVVYDILRSYGTSGLLDPVEEPAPNDWYDALPGRSYLIADYPTIPLHVHQMSKRTLSTREIVLTIPARVQGTPPPWRVQGWRVWEEFDGMRDKMFRDLRTLFVETKAHATGQRDHSRQGQPHAFR